MALPTTLTPSGKSNSTGAGVSPAEPTGVADGDLEILVASTIAGGSITITANGGGAWTPLGTGSQDVTSGEKLYVWYRIRQTGDGAPTVTPGGDHICATMYGYHGVDQTTPVEAIAWSSEVTSDQSYSFATGVSTTVNDCVVCTIYSSGADSNTGQAGTVFANASLTNVALLAEYNTTSGGGGGFAILEGDKATAGTTGTWSDTMVTATTKAYVSFAVRSVQPVVYTDADTVPSVTSPSSAELMAHDYLDNATVPIVTGITSDEFQSYLYLDSATVPAITGITSGEIYSVTYLDSDIAASATSLTDSSEAAQYTDLDILAGATTLTSDEYRTSVYDDSATISSVSATSYTELADHIDTATLLTQTFLITDDIAGFVDSDTIASAVSISFTEVSEFVEADTGTIVTTSAAVEVFESLDAQTVLGVTTVESAEDYTPATNNQKAYPISDVSATGWSASAGAVSLYTMIDEVTPDDSDYIYATAV